MHSKEKKVDRSSLKLTLQIKDSQYTIKGSTSNSDQEGSEQESVDEQSPTMTEPTIVNERFDEQNTSMTDSNNTSLNDDFEKNGDGDLSVGDEEKSDSHDTIDNNDELSNTSFEEDNKSFLKNEPDASEDLSDASLSHKSENSSAQDNDRDEGIAEPSSSSRSSPAPQTPKEAAASAAPDPPLVIKQEKTENGEVPESKAPNGRKPLTKDDEGFSDAETELVPEDEGKAPPTQPLISVRKTEDLMMSRVAPPQINGANEECNVCCERFPSPGALEQHRATAGHYSCNLSQECSNQVFQTPSELGQHQAMAHQPPVQQLAQQVQRIPASFTSPTYRPTSPQQRNNVYMNSPQMGGSGATQQQIGSGVVLSTVPSTPSVPNLPPGIQLSKRPAMTPPQASSPKQRREEESRPGIRLPDSITLVKNVAPTPPKKDSVTDMLANRGITVVPSGRSSSSPQQAPSPVIPRSLMNTSAISITPSSQNSAQHRSSNFAVPQKPVSRVLTVDLTKEADTPPRRSFPPPNRGGRIRGPTGRSVCQICDKAFPTPQELSQHMACHRGGGAPNKLAYECRECTAQYPTEAGLQAHRLKYHGAGGPSPDMAIPVVDLKQNGVMSRLAALGIRTVIPLAQLHSSGTGSSMFALPVVAVDSASNPAICNIGGLGASNLLPLGPLKNLSYPNNMR